MNISAIPPDMVGTFWSRIEAGCAALLEAHSTGRWSVEDVRENCERGDWQLFIVSDSDDIVACLVCSIPPHRRKTLEIGLCWGKDAASWSGDMSQVFDQVGREMGCEQLALDGRPGWRRIMRQLGFQTKSVTYTRPING